MKQILVILVLFMTSCTNMNKPLTDDQKAKTESEAKEFVAAIIEACEKADPAQIKSLLDNSPDFVSVYGGSFYNYDHMAKEMVVQLAPIASQKSTIRNEKYVILDATSVLYTADTGWETKLKNDSTFRMDPLCLQLFLKKTDNQWKVLSWTEALK